MGIVKQHQLEMAATQGVLDDLKDSLFTVPWSSWETDFIETISEDWDDLSPRQKFKAIELHDKLIEELLPMAHAMSKDD